VARAERHSVDVLRLSHKDDGWSARARSACAVYAKIN